MPEIAPIEQMPLRLDRYCTEGIATAKAGLQYPLMPEGLFYGPRQYKPSLSKKLFALENYLVR